MTERKKRLIYLIVYLAYTSMYISRVNLSVAETTLESMSLFDAAGYGLIGGLFSAIYSIGRLVNGGIGDKTPPWVMLSVGLGFAGLANIAIGFLPPYIGILLLWSMNAYAQSMLWSSVLSVVSTVYEGPRMKRMTSLMVTAVATGNIVAILLGGWLIGTIGVGFAFIIPGAINILLGAAVAIATRGIGAGADNTKLTPHKSMISLLRNKDILLMCIPSVFHGVMKENVTVWMVAYAVYAYGIDLSESAYYVLLIPLIGLAGRLAYPAILRLCRERENTVSFIGFAICAVASLLLLFPTLGVVCTVVALGVVYASTSVINTSITSIYPVTHHMNSGNVSSVSGLLDFASYLGAGIASAIYGVVISAVGYEPMFISWMLLSLASLAVLWYIARYRARSKAEEMASHGDGAA